MTYYSAIKRNDLSRHEKTRRKLKCMLSSERRKSQKVPYCMTFWKKSKTMEIVKRSVVARSLEEGRER